MSVAVNTDTIKNIWQSYVVNWRDSIALINSPALWPQWLKTLISTRLPKILVIVLVLLISYLVASVTWQAIIPLFWKKSPVTDVSSKTYSVKTAAVKQTKPDYTYISEQHLFGYVPPVKKQQLDATLDVPEVAPATRLKLSLHGIFIYSGPKDGAAIIGEGGKNQRYYKTGDEIQKDMELVEVRKDHVLLMRKGRFETLRFPKLEKPPVAKTTDDKKAQETTVNIKEYRELFEKQPEKIAEHFDVVPVMEKGILKGYRIRPQSNRSLYDEIGLKPDDLLVAVNGIPLTDRSQLSSVIAELSDAEFLTVNLVRNNQQKTILLDLR